MNPQIFSSTALELMRGEGNPEAALRVVADEISTVEPHDVPSAGPGLLLSAVAAAHPETDPRPVRDAIVTAISNADLQNTQQAALDELFRMLDTLTTMVQANLLQPLLTGILETGNVHPRWAERAIDLLAEITFWQAAFLDLDQLVHLLGQLPEALLEPFVANVLEPVIFTRPATLTPEQIDRMTASPEQTFACRYLLYALSENPVVPALVRELASAHGAATLPLQQTWRDLTAGRGLKVVCIHNIADGLGDEIVRVNPFLQALLDDHPETNITLVTDRPALWSHSRLTVISFDQPDAIRAALGAQPDVLFRLIEAGIPHLNHDPDLMKALDDPRGDVQPFLYILSGKRWNGFTFDSVQLNGVEWATATGFDKIRGRSGYDPVNRLIAELGIPLRTGTNPPPSGTLLAANEQHAATSWRQMMSRNVENRPVVLINPFGGSAAIKGFVRRKLDDLAAILGELIAGGSYLIITPNSDWWGSPNIAEEAIQRLDPDQRRYTTIAQIPERRDLSLQSLLHAISTADRIVTIEGWMGHAAWALGKPVETLMVAGSEGHGWLPSGRDAVQQPRMFRGNPRLDQPPLPEQPRRGAWLQLLQRIRDVSWQPFVEDALNSEDADIRRLATVALQGMNNPGSTAKLVGLLRDPNHRVRGTAAGALMNRRPANVDPAMLWAYRTIGAPHPNWMQVEHAGAAIRPALQAALDGDSPVIRREAAIVVEALGKRIFEDPNWMDRNHD